MKNIRKLMIAGTALGMLGTSVTAGNIILSKSSRGGIILHAPTKENLVNGTGITNNNDYGNESSVILAEPSAGSGVICNNLYYSDSGGAWVSYSVGGIITNSDPEFLNATNGGHLQKCAQAIDSGLKLSKATNDYDGLPRPIPAGPKRRL